MESSDHLPHPRAFRFARGVFRFGPMTALTIVALLYRGTTVCAGTEVGGPITSDTIWTAANSSYVVVADEEIKQSVTLIGLDPSANYTFRATDYDNQGHESWYSNLVSGRGGYHAYLPTLLKGGSGSHCSLPYGGGVAWGSCTSLDSRA